MKNFWCNPCRIVNPSASEGPKVHTQRHPKIFIGQPSLNSTAETENLPETFAQTGDSGERLTNRMLGDFKSRCSKGGSKPCKKAIPTYVMVFYLLETNLLLHPRQFLIEDPSPCPGLPDMTHHHSKQCCTFIFLKVNKEIALLNILQNHQHGFPAKAFQLDLQFVMLRVASS